MVVATEPTTIQKVMQLASALTDEAIRTRTIKKNPEKKGNSGELGRDRNARDDNKRGRTGNAFATTVNHVRREYNGKDCRAPRMVNSMNARNPSATPRGRGNDGNQARGRAFMLEAEEACQDPNIMIGIEPSDLGFSYEIEIASGVIGERPDKRMRYLMSAKASEQKLEEIVVVRDFFEVFPDDLSGLPPTREIEFRIELILEQCRLQSLLIDWHLLKWRSCQNNSGNSRIRVSFDQVHRLREHQCYLLRRKMVLSGCALIIEN
ncbi:hypothetical protein Tco_1410516 [Tanacetum coccineum]